jgi:acetolactate synthase I/II/III large subunit
MSESVAARYLAALAGRGIDNLFVNAGTDFAPIVEAYARNKQAGGATFPTPVVCAHENLAAGMAHGAYLASGRPQAVMFHVSVGTANAICAVMNAARDQVPMLVTAGRSPILEHGAVGARDMSIHWAQEMFDQGGMLRELVKWDYELRDTRQVEAVVDRALAVATTHPRGPVYLALPRELLAEEATGAAPALPVTPVPAAVHPDSAAVDELAARLAAARFPVIVASASGADPASVALLDECCRRFAIGVADNAPRYLNVAADHPLHLGPALGGVLERADVVLFVECDVPWIAARAAPADDAFVAQAGVDPLFARYPMRTHRADLTIAATPSALFEALLAALADREGGIDPGRAAVVRSAAADAAATVERVRAREAAAGADAPISKPAIAAALGAALDADDIVFNEYWAPPELLRRTQPRTYFYLPPAGGLGWALPAALGAKHARPERTVVAAVGDGAYMFANPSACHHAAAKHGLPVLTVIADNSTWGAVDLATRSVYPAGRAVAGGEDRFSDLSPAPDFAAYCRASGGHGELVTSRDRLAPAIEEALDVVRGQGRQALLDVRCV